MMSDVRFDEDPPWQLLFRLAILSRYLVVRSAKIWRARDERGKLEGASNLHV